MENTKTTTASTNDQVVQVSTSQGVNPFIAPPVAPSLDSDKLLAALYWIWDAFERTNMPFFLVDTTAEDAMKQKDLHGNGVYVGVKQTEWISGGRRILDAFIAPVEETAELVTYEHEGVPVYVKVYEVSDCIEQTDMIRYRYEEFKVPNPYSKFLEIYG